MMMTMLLILSSVLGWVHVYGTTTGKTIIVDGHAPMEFNANGHWVCDHCDAYIFEQNKILPEFLKRWIVGECTMPEFNIISRNWYCMPATTPEMDAEPELQPEVTRLGVLIERGIDVTGEVLVTPFGKKFHRWGCAYAASGQPVTLLEAVADGKEPCRVCQDGLIITIFEGF